MECFADHTRQIFKLSLPKSAIIKLTYKNNKIVTRQIRKSEHTIHNITCWLSATYLIIFLLSLLYIHQNSAFLDILENYFARSEWSSVQMPYSWLSLWSASCWTSLRALGTILFAYKSNQRNKKRKSGKLETSARRTPEKQRHQKVWRIGGS